MIKLAIIGSRGYPYVYGGFETFVKEVSERLADRGVEVHVYCQKNLFREHPAVLNGIHLHYIPTVSSKSLNQLVHSLLSIIHASFSKADVILALNLAAGPMGWIPKLTGKKTMINVDGLEWQRPKWKGLGAAYFRFAARIATRLYDLIITDADAMRQVYLDEFGADSRVIAYGAPKYKEISRGLLKRFGIESRTYYLIVGRLIPDNNADLIIKAFLGSDSEKKLVVVGDVPYKDSYAEGLKSLANERLIFTGYVNDSSELMALYQNCFAYFHGHQFGGTNPAMLKAMSNKCAILALDTSFNREMLGNGSFGYLFQSNTLAIRQVMTDIESDETKADDLRRNVGKGLTKKYDWDSVADEYKDAMIAICKK